MRGSGRPRSPLAPVTCAGRRRRRRWAGGHSGSRRPRRPGVGAKRTGPGRAAVGGGRGSTARSGARCARRSSGVDLPTCTGLSPLRSGAADTSSWRSTGGTYFVVRARVPTPPCGSRRTALRAGSEDETAGRGRALSVRLRTLVVDHGAPGRVGWCLVERAPDCSLGPSRSVWTTVAARSRRVREARRLSGAHNFRPPGAAARRAGGWHRAPERTRSEHHRTEPAAGTSHHGSGCRGVRARHGPS